MAAGTRDRWNLFVCSFTILFVELVCIRWIPAYIRYLGYFTNFVLLGAFLGIGLGILQARRRLDLHTFFPAALAVLVWVVSTFKLQLTINSSQEVFFQDLAVKVHGTESFFLLPLVFGVVTLLFTLLGQNLGRLLAAVPPPLTSYTIDVAGSIAGSLLFALVSFLGSPPGVWFGLAALGVLALPPAPSPSGLRAPASSPPGSRGRRPRGGWARGGRGGLVRVLNAGILLGVVVGVSVLGRSSSWSPYYRIDGQPRPGHGWALFVNNIGHQEVAPYAVRVRRSIFYVVPFKTFHFPPSTRELIIGAGSGSDPDIAYHNGIRHITAGQNHPALL